MSSIFTTEDGWERCLFLPSFLAPGQSAKNQVERRMAPLSRDLSGLILKHDSFGSHLDSNRRTIDHNLEIRNFCRAGEVLAEVWSDTIIDGEPVVARFVEPNLILPGVDLPSEKWLSVHVRQSQYCLQIVKCEYPNCCKNWRSNYLQWFPNRFLPVPHKIVKSVFGPKPADQTVKEGHFGTLFQQICAQGMLQPAGFERMPFDFYCPSVRSELGKRVCSDCGIYHSSIVSLKRHRKELHNKTFRERIGSDPDEEMNVSMEEEEMDGPAPVDETEEVFPVIDRNIFELIREDFPFEEVQE